MTERRFRTILAALVALHFVVLVAVLRQSLGHLLDVEEDFVAFVAREVLGGARLPLSTYVYTDYEAGTLYMGLLAVPFFALMGSTVLALKSVSITVALVTLTLVGLVGRRIVGERAALVAVALLAVGPPAWLFRGLQTFGDTSEAIPLALLQWWVFLLWLKRPDAGPRWLVGQGALAGLATSFSLATAPFQLALLLAGYASTERVRPARVAALVGGLLLGFALPLINWLAYGIPFWNVRGKGVGTAGTGPLAWLASFGALFRGHFAPGFYLQDHPAELLSVLPYLPRYFNLLLMAPVFALVWIRRVTLLALLRAAVPYRRQPVRLEPVDLLLLLHGAFLAAYLLTSYQSGYLLLLIAPSGALLAGHAVFAGGRARWAWTWVAALLLVELVPLAALWMPRVDVAQWAVRPAATPLLSMEAGGDAHWRGGIRWRHLAREIAPGDVPGLAARLSADEVEARELFGIGMLLPLYPGVLPELAAALPEEKRRELLRGYGYGLAWNGDAGHPAAVKELQAMDAALREDALQGFGRCLGERFHRVGARQLNEVVFSKLLDERQRQQCLEGFGFGYGWRMWNNAQYFQHEVLPLGKASLPPVLHGLLRRYDRLAPRAEWPPMASMDLHPDLYDLLPEDLRD